MGVVSDIIILTVAALALVLAFFALLAQRTMKRRMNGAFQEIAALGMAQQKLVERLKHAADSTPVPVAPVAPERAAGRQQRKPAQPVAGPAPEHETLWQDVVFLAKQGLSADTIARDLNITRGEVELILGLHNFKPKKSE